MSVTIQLMGMVVVAEEVFSHVLMVWDFDGFRWRVEAERPLVFGCWCEGRLRVVGDTNQNIAPVTATCKHPIGLPLSPPRVFIRFRLPLVNTTPHHHPPSVTSAAMVSFEIG